MKPNFALLLSFEGIGLLHRSGQAGWHLVGEVPLDADDLGEDLAALRSKALALDPSGLSTKLIIPDEQIRYMDLPAPRDDDQDLAVREALEGATPYHVDDLSYDWSLSDGRLYIAAVASETLDEAESFAVEHRFNPVSFVARAETDIFVGEPFFGAAAQARDVERDTVPVQILGRAHMPEAPDSVVSAEADTAKPVVASKAPPPAPTPDPEPQDTAPVPTFSSIRGPLSDPGRSGDDLEPGSATSGPSGEATPKELPELRNMATASLAPIPEETTADPDERSSKPVRPSQTAPGVAPVRPIGPSSQTAAVSPAAEAERLTIFGARREAAIGGKPRFLGLILTAILLLFLIGVAAFATIFSNQGFSGLFGNSEPAIALTPAPEPAPEPAQATDQADSAALQVPPTPEIATPPQAEPQPEVQPAPDSLSVAPDPVAGQNAADPVSEADDRGAPLDNDGQAESAPEAEPAYLAEARRLSRYAATGIWHEPPEPPAVPDAGSVDDIYQTSIDVAVDLRDAVALPAQPETRSDRRPATPPAPVEAGTTFDLDQRGLVIATPDGALTPAGVPVRSGPPPARPPEVPPRAVPLADGALDAETAAELTRLGGIRPRSRPEDLIEQQERGALSGRTRSELAALRPRVRPQVPDRETAAADPDARAASLAGALLQAQPEAGDEVAILPQAVDTSAKPRQRPAAVERAAAQSADTAVPAAASAAPRIPTRASVARQATATNAINLRNVNLIGVYGTRQDRRALVRLSSGRYQKVKVGDRLDGGRVLAIGDAELRYNRRGRNVVLRLPKG